MRPTAALILASSICLAAGPLAAPKKKAPNVPPGPANVHFVPAGTAPLPGRGLALSWSPDGSAIAAGGHFKEPATGQRYDTRIVDVASRTLRPAGFNCHYWWVVATAWTLNPFIGEVIADGGGDHAVKIWDASGPGSTSCKPGQFHASEGGIESLFNINGWITSLDFSPDGRYLAGASRDRAIRIWQIESGTSQWKVVRAWYDKTAGNFLSVRWSPDGRRLVTGDREGRVAEWPFDPVTDRWSDATIAAYAKVGWQNQIQWFSSNPTLGTKTPLWMDGKHKEVWNARYSPDGQRVAAGGADGTLSVYAAQTGTLIYRVVIWKNTPLHGLDWSPDGALIAAGGADKRIWVFNAIDGTPYDRLEGHGEVVSAIAWSPDGSTLASTAGGPLLKLSLNDISTGPDDVVRFWTQNP